MDIRAPFKALISLVCLLLMILVLSPAYGVVEVQETGPSSGPGQTAGYDEAEAQAIDRMLMCPVCPAETIDQAQVELARQMRQVVREMLSQGASRNEILDFFVGNYGMDVLAAPPKSGFNLLAWILPAAAVVVALGAGLVVIRSMTARGVEPSVAAIGAEEALAPYLEAVDRDLGLDLGILEGPGGPTRTAKGDIVEKPPLEEGLRRDG